MQEKVPFQIRPAQRWEGSLAAQGMRQADYRIDVRHRAIE